MSNVRYQQALTKVQATAEKLAKDREDALKNINAMEIENAKLKVRITLSLLFAVVPVVLRLFVLVVQYACTF